MTEAWARDLVLGVLGEALRASGAGGVVMAGGGPERELLGRWLAHGNMRVVSPNSRAMAVSQEVLLASTPSSDRPETPWPHGATFLAAAALAHQGNLLLLGTDTKTHLLLSSALPLAPVLPLGDLFASDVLDFQGACSVPQCLEGVDPEDLRMVDESLQAWLETSCRLDDALSQVDESLRSTLESALEKTQRGWRPRYLVPQLRGPTLGIDLDL